MSKSTLAGAGLAMLWLNAATCRAEPVTGQQAAEGGAAPLLTRIGPSFPCPTPQDPLAQLICASPDLSRTDLAFVQVYQAYRQSLTPEGQKALRADSVEFGASVRRECGIAKPQAIPNAPTPPPAPVEAAACVAKAYERQ